jgi:hypothetical protein
MSADAYTQAWVNAEKQLAIQIASFLPLGLSSSNVDLIWAVGRNVFIGDEIDLSGRINLIVAQIEGGGPQDQAFDGAMTWYTTGRVIGMFSERINALSVACAFLNPLNIPFEGGPGTPRPNISKVFLQTHPEVRRVRHQLANIQDPVLATRIEVQLGVVYNIEVRS